MNTEELIEEIENITTHMFATEQNVYHKIKVILSYINNICQMLLQILPDLKSMGVDLDSEYILQQLHSVVEAVEKNDEVLLFDVLTYEIKETLKLWIEIEKMVE